MVQKKIYFVENLHGIQYFLSLYQPEDENIIVVSKEAKASIMFLQEIIPDEEKLLVPRISLSGITPKEQFEAQKAEIVSWRNRYSCLFSHIQPPAKAYFLGTQDSIHFFILLKQLHDKGIDIKYVNAHPEFSHAPIPEHVLNMQYRCHLEELSKLIGLKVIAEKCRAWTAIALANYPKPIDYTPDSWQVLCEKYSWSFKKLSERAVLLIDGPIQSFREINIEKSQKMLLAFLRELIAEGKTIHLKPHYNERIDYNSLSGTYLEREVKILPKYFPVELIMNQYPEVYGYGSTALATPIKGKKYSLAKLLQFNSSDGERVFREIFSDASAGSVRTKQLNNGLIELFDKQEDQIADLKQVEQTKPSVSVSEKEAEISILIPTLNRSDFLIRALSYYGKVGFKGWICIGDSSNAQHSDRIKRIIHTLEDRLNIIYKYFPKPPYDVQMCLKKLIEISPTPYVVYSGDDDILIPSSLAQCAAFLEDHPEYSAAHGLRIAYKLKGGGEFGEIEHINHVQQHIWKSEKASKRWVGYVRHAFSTQYYVHRKETWKRMYKDIGSVPSFYLGTEFLPCSLTAILGKVKQLECLSTLFQIQDHDRPIGWFFNLVIHPDWSHSVQGLRHSIVEALMKYDGANEKIAQEIFDREFWHHIKSVLLSQYQKKYGGLPENRIDTRCNLSNSKQSIYALITHQNWSKSIESMRADQINMVAKQEGISAADAQNIFDRKLWGHLLLLLYQQYQQKYTDEHIHAQAGLPQSNACNYQESLSLGSLLNPSSPFYNDFVPALQVITRKSKLGN